MADAARRAVKHRAVRCATTREPVPLDEPGKPAPFRFADHVDEIILVENIYQNLIADVGRFVARLNPHFAQHASRRDAGALEVSLGRFVDSARRLLFDKPKLNGIIAVRVHGLLLHDYAGPSLYHRHRRHRAVFRKQLRHPKLFTNYSVDHINSERMRDEG